MNEKKKTLKGQPLKNKVGSLKKKVNKMVALGDYSLLTSS
jgi:hypothetical protein